MTRSKHQETPLLYKGKPFGVLPFDQIEMTVDKGCLIDEQLCHDLFLPIKKLHYKSFSIYPGQVTRSTGHVKFSAQFIEKGKVGRSIYFQATVIRNLTIITGADSVAGEQFSEKLLGLPVKPFKPKEQLKNWLNKHWESPALASSTIPDNSTHPAATTTVHPCNCSWSNQATASSLPCCTHKGLCQTCQDLHNELANDELENSDDQDEEECLISCIQEIPPSHYSWDRNHPFANTKRHQDSKDDEIFIAVGNYVPNITDVSEEGHLNERNSPGDTLEEKTLRHVAAEFGYTNVADYLDDVEDDDDDTEEYYDDDEENNDDMVNETAPNDELSALLAEHGYPPAVTNHSTILRSGGWSSEMDDRIHDNYMKYAPRSNEDEDQLSQLAQEYGYS